MITMTNNTARNNEPLYDQYSQHVWSVHASREKKNGYEFVAATCLFMGQIPSQISNLFLIWLDTFLCMAYR